MQDDATAEEAKRYAKTSFSAFMKDGPIEEREQMLEIVVRRSNADQRDLVERFDKQQKVGVTS
ncbi:MAG: hypothetical protein WA021_02690 [Minisyncoccia bacterium]